MATDGRSLPEVCVDLESAIDFALEAEFLPGDACHGLLELLSLVRPVAGQEPLTIRGLVSPPDKEGSTVDANYFLDQALPHCRLELAEVRGDTWLVFFMGERIGDGL